MSDVEKVQMYVFAGISGFFVDKADYDTAQSELAALRTSLESMRDRKNSIVDLQQRLAAAEQRNAERDELFRIIHKDYRDDIGSALWELIDAALKPTESGASE